MKKLSNRDWAIAVTIGVLSFFLGFAVKAIWDSRKEATTIGNSINPLVKHNDSLELIIVKMNRKDD